MKQPLDRVHMQLFEFMDIKLLPRGLRHTLRDILECGNSLPFRRYNHCLASMTADLAAACRLKRVVELGAGSAPLTRELLARGLCAGVILTPCDVNPDISAYEQLQRLHPQQVQPIFTAVDFSQARSWEAGTLLVLSGTFHHIPFLQRPLVLQQLTSGADWVIVSEPLRHTVTSALFVMLSVIPAFLLPLIVWNRQGLIRRLLWCWILPAAPFLFVWDGLVSVLRIWGVDMWRKTTALLAGDEDWQLSVEESWFCQAVTLRRAHQETRHKPVESFLMIHHENRGISDVVHGLK